MRILVVEDEAQIADFVVRGLREEGFEVVHAADGDAAWKALQNSTWDAVLLDWWLPEQDGLTILKKFRQKNSETPVIFLTARDSVTDRVRGLNAGADDYLCKPFAFEELLARVRVLSRRRDQTAKFLLHYSDVTYDLATQRAERAGKELDLKTKEQALLIYFLQNPGEVLSRQRIYESVWEEKYDGLSNTLEVHVMELRRKLEQHGPRIIHTLRGRGYFFGEVAPSAAKE
jgi:two-component system copper resistance phosphate regulon response regulator CusR